MRVLAVLLLAAHAADAVSPVQKVVELLDEWEAKAMEEYTTFCDDELKDKGYAIETAGSEIEDLSATAEDASAQITELADEISTLGTTIAGKEKELYDATKIRKTQHGDFVASEKELLTSIDQLSRAVI